MRQAINTNKRGRTDWRDRGPSRAVSIPSSRSIKVAAQMGDFSDDGQSDDDGFWGAEQILVQTLPTW